MPPIHTQMTCREWSLLILLSIIWGSSFFFQGYAVHALPPLTIVWLRLAIAAVSMVIIVRVFGQRVALNRQTFMPFVALGLVGLGLPFSLLVWAQTHITSSLASILNGLTPMCIMVVAQIFTNDEKINSRKIIGMVVGFTGVALMIGPEALRGITNDVLAQLGCIGACVCYAFASVFGRRLSKFDLKPAEIVTGQCIAASILLLPVTIIIEAPWRIPNPDLLVWGAVLGLAIISTSLAYMLFYRILATAGATNIGLVTFMVPITAVSLGVLILGESLELQHIFGASGIAVGLGIIDGRLLSWLR